MSNIFSVVDIGTQQIRVIVGQPDGNDKVSVLGVGEVPADGIDDNGVAHVDRLVQAIHKALTQANQQSQVAISRVWVVTNHMYLYGEQADAVIAFSDPEHEISLQDLQLLRQQAVQRPAKPDMELIHVVPQYYSIDHRDFVREPLGMTGVRLEGYFYLVYAPQSYLTMLRKCFSRLDIEIEGFVARPLATAEVFLSREHKTSGVALLYMGNHSTGIVLYENGFLKHFSMLPLGGYQVTMDIREMLRYVLPSQAEEIKVSQGVAFADMVPPDEYLRLRVSQEAEAIDIHRRTMAQVIQARLSETLVFVAKEIKQAGLLDKLYGGIYIAGGGALMPGMSDLIEYELGVRTYTVRVAQVLGRGMTSRVNNPRMAGAVAGLYLAPILKEFMPPVLPPTPTKGKEKSPSRPKQRSQILQKVRSLLENTIKLPQDLID